MNVTFYGYIYNVPVAVVVKLVIATKGNECPEPNAQGVVDLCSSCNPNLEIRTKILYVFSL